MARTRHSVTQSPSGLGFYRGKAGGNLHVISVENDVIKIVWSTETLTNIAYEPVVLTRDGIATEFAIKTAFGKFVRDEYDGVRI